LADGDIKVFDGVDGNHRSQHVTSADINLDLSGYCPFFDIGDGAFDDITCADFHKDTPVVLEKTAYK
jgi:hypothetical protein